MTIIDRGRRAWRHLKDAGRRGVSLIELIAVAIILGMLALIVVPNVVNALGISKGAALSSTLAEIQSASDQFYAINSEYPTYSQPGACPSASEIDPGAASATGSPFVAGYLRTRPTSSPADLGLNPANGATVYYGVVAGGTLFATQAQPSNGQWSNDPGITIYSRSSAPRPTQLGTECGLAYGFLASAFSDSTGSSVLLGIPEFGGAATSLALPAPVQNGGPYLAADPATDMRAVAPGGAVIYTAAGASSKWQALPALSSDVIGLAYASNGDLLATTAGELEEWTGGTWSDLGAPPTSGDTWSGAPAVGPSGQVALIEFSSNGSGSIATLTQSGWIALPDPGAGASNYPQAVTWSQAGQPLGAFYVQTSTGTTLNTLFEYSSAGGSWTDLGPNISPASGGPVLAVDSTGQIVVAWQGDAAEYANGHWSSLSAPSYTAFNDVMAKGSTFYLAGVGIQGVLWSLTGTTWTKLYQSSTGALFSTVGPVWY